MSTLHRINLQPAYVLHHTPYRNTSVLLEVFTREHGRTGLVARGARSARSRTSGMLQPFSPLLLSWSGKGDLGTLTATEANGPALTLKGRVLLSAFYLNELLLRLCQRHDPHALLFDQYDKILHQLNELSQMTIPDTLEQDSDVSEEKLLRIFEKYLLQELGYGLVLDHDVITEEPIHANERYRYQPDIGPVCMEKAGTSGVSLSGRSLLSLAADELFDHDCLREIKHLMRAALAPHLGNRPLHSRRLFSEMNSPQ